MDHRIPAKQSHGKLQSKLVKDQKNWSDTSNFPVFKREVVELQWWWWNFICCSVFVGAGYCYALLLWWYCEFGGERRWGSGLLNCCSDSLFQWIAAVLESQQPHHGSMLLHCFCLFALLLLLWCWIAFENTGWRKKVWCCCSREKGKARERLQIWGIWIGLLATELWRVEMLLMGKVSLCSGFGVMLLRWWLLPCLRCYYDKEGEGPHCSC